MSSKEGEEDRSWGVRGVGREGLKAGSFADFRSS